MTLIKEFTGVFKIKISNSNILPDVSDPPSINNSLGEIIGEKEFKNDILIVKFIIPLDFHSTSQFDITHIGIFYNNTLIDYKLINKTIKTEQPYIFIWRMAIR